MKEALKLSGISKRFGDVRAVDGLTLSIGEGETMSLLGSSGCGKTTVLRLIAGFETPGEGSIEIGGRLVHNASVSVPPEKRRVGMVFQDYALFPHMNVSANTAFGLENGTGRAERVREMLALVGLEGLESRMPHELSGGQQQRLALARALAPGPGIMLLDEPFSNLDTRLRVQIREEIRDILRRSGASTIFVTHDRDEAFFMGDRVSVMDRGRIEQTGRPYDLYHRPLSRRTAEFLGTADFIPCRVSDGVMRTELGILGSPFPAGAGADGVEMLLRPDDVMLTEPHAGGNGTVVSCTFRGTSYLYRVKLDSGRTVHSLCPHSQEIETGTRIDAGLDPHYKPVFFKNGARVNADPV